MKFFLLRESLEIIEEAVVEQQAKPVRLSDLRSVFATIPSRKGLKKAIDKGLVILNKSRASTADWVRGGETLSLLRERSSRPELRLDIEVLFEDDQLAVVNKPAGILVSGNKHRTLENALPFNLQQSGQLDALDWPQPIHRLDFPTSGVLLVGKTRNAVTSLNKQFVDHVVDKEYLAITEGEMPPFGEVVIPVDGKSAHTLFERLDQMQSENFGALNMVRLKLLTGRRHQIRKHMAAIGSPIHQDGMYGSVASKSRGNRLFLHARSLSFDHPISGERLKISCGLPDKFTDFALKIESVD